MSGSELQLQELCLFESSALASHKLSNKQSVAIKDLQIETVQSRLAEREIENARQSAQKAVDYFVSSHLRHTAALKGVKDYIATASSYFSKHINLTQKPSTILLNVELMLSKLENWEKEASWLKPGDKAQIMSRICMDSLTMDKFDQWFASINSHYATQANCTPASILKDLNQHLERRVAIESVKHYLRMLADIESFVSPIVQKGFETVASGKLANGVSIPEGSDLIVFELKKIKIDGEEKEFVVPYAKQGAHMQRFDKYKIITGLKKQEVMAKAGPSAFANEDLYGFRLDHDPGRLAGCATQIGYAILRPGGPYGKNILYMEFSPDINPELIPKGLRADSTSGPGTNTGVIYSMLRKLSSDKVQLNQTA